MEAAQALRPSPMSDDAWDIVIRRIRDRKCTPFLGAGATVGTLPLGRELALEWAEKFDYPLDDCDDLTRVSQFLAVQKDAVFPKDEVRARFEKLAPPDFSQEDEPHAVLASLPLPVYLTTNYDDFMVKALERRGKRPVRELCQWKDRPSLRALKSVFDSPEGYYPTPEAPIVYHLHGCLEVPESLVLTEDDYLDFLVAISRSPDLLPPRIQEALSDASLLFVGYQLRDWDFRVLFRGLVELTDPSGRRLSVTVQLPPTQDESRRAAVQAYLDKYFGELKVRVYWGPASQFVAELRQRWNAAEAGA